MRAASRKVLDSYRTAAPVDQAGFCRTEMRAPASGGWPDPCTQQGGLVQVSFRLAHRRRLANRLEPAGGMHMKVVVIGGTGLIGSKLVATLRARGHQVLPASPDSGVNTLTGEGLSAALAGAQVVVDVANSPSFEDEAVMKFFQTSG